MVVSADGMRTWRYWDIDPELRIRYRRQEEYVEHFHALFTDRRYAIAFALRASRADDERRAGTPLDLGRCSERWATGGSRASRTPSKS